MAFNYIFTDAAKADLDEILSYISTELSNPTAASSFFDSFEKTLKLTYDPRIVFLILTIIFVLLDIAVRKFKFKWPHELMRERKMRKMGSSSETK